MSIPDIFEDTYILQNIATHKFKPVLKKFMNGFGDSMIWQIKTPPSALFFHVGVGKGKIEIVGTNNHQDFSLPGTIKIVDSPEEIIFKAQLKSGIASIPGFQYGRRNIPEVVIFYESLQPAVEDVPFGSPMTDLIEQQPGEGTHEYLKRKYNLTLNDTSSGNT